MTFKHCVFEIFAFLAFKHSVIHNVFVVSTILCIACVRILENTVSVCFFLQ